jgi:hypothetical protein
MKVSDIIRQVISQVDSLETEQSAQARDQEYKERADDNIARFKQVKDLLPDEHDRMGLANSPKERYADVDSVTKDAGGGPNGPKHPSDIRGEHASMYPSAQWRGE